MQTIRHNLVGSIILLTTINSNYGGSRSCIVIQLECSINTIAIMVVVVPILATPTQRQKLGFHKATCTCHSSFIIIMSIKHTSQLSFVAAIQQCEMDTVPSDAARLKLECQVMIICFCD